MDKQKNTYSAEDLAAKKTDFIFLIVCIVLAVVVVGISCYFIFSEKYDLEIEIRLEFDSGEYRDGCWYIPYDGSNHSPTITFWDGDYRVFYRRGDYWNDSQYSYYFKRESDGLVFNSISEKGVYELKINVGAYPKNNKTKYLAASKSCVVEIY